MRRASIFRNLEQLTENSPVSTPRKPRGLHRGPGRRQISEKEIEQWKFMKKTQLQSIAEWKDLDTWKHLPKAKKLFGNEATEIVWPYAVLLENECHVHPFTKSIYCYYFQHSLTPRGKRRIELARQFARECMIPITFHNAQCYVETEMLLEYGDLPYLVINCLDERQFIFPIYGESRPHEFHEKASSEGSGYKEDHDTQGKNGQGNNPPESGIKSESQVPSEFSYGGLENENLHLISTNAAKGHPEGKFPLHQYQHTGPYTKRDLLREVIAATHFLGNGIRDVTEAWRVYNERPNQNHYIRVDYQWFGETPEERSQHTVQFDWSVDNTEVATPPFVSNRRYRRAAALNMTDGVTEMFPRAKGRMGNSATQDKSTMWASKDNDPRTCAAGSRWGAPARHTPN